MLRFVSLLLAWTAVVGIGSYTMFEYDQTPGETGSPSAKWPNNPYIPANPERPTLVMFAHPHCPCTRASLHELSMLMTHCQGRVDAYVLLLKPVGAADDWLRTDLRDQAEQIPGVTVIADHNGQLAEQFDVQTSGETVLYDEAGVLRFHGGITASRGHQGDNAGRSSIASLLTRNSTNVSTTCVFGCPLHNETSNPARDK